MSDTTNAYTAKGEFAAYPDGNGKTLDIRLYKATRELCSNKLTLPPTMLS